MLIFNPHSRRGQKRCSAAAREAAAATARAEWCVRLLANVSLSSRSWDTFYLSLEGTKGHKVSVVDMWFTCTTHSFTSLCRMAQQQPFPAHNGTHRNRGRVKERMGFRRERKFCKELCKLCKEDSNSKTKEENNSKTTLTSLSQSYVDTYLWHNTFYF